MTEGEVDLIYAYLHEHYDYQDGNLIARHDIKHSKRKGQLLGSFFYQGSGGSSKIRASIKTNGMHLRWPLSHFIWFYFNKEKPKYIHHLDLNPLNNKIENIINCSLTLHQAMRTDKRKGYKIKKNKDGSVGYRVSIEHNYKKINIGTFSSKKIAKDIYIKGRELLEKGTHDPQLLRDELIKLFPEQPIQNRKINNKFGMKGVYKNHNKFVARLTNNKKLIILGYFLTAEEAHAAYLKAKEEYNK